MKLSETFASVPGCTALPDTAAAPGSRKPARSRR